MRNDCTKCNHPLYIDSSQGVNGFAYVRCEQCNTENEIKISRGETIMIKDTRKVHCISCNGAGVVRVNEKDRPIYKRVCKACKGTGRR